MTDTPADRSTPEATAPAAASVLVIVAHPSMEQSRVNRRLMRAAAEAGSHVTVRDLYRLYPDYLIDVAAEQEVLSAAQLIVWQHPIHWYSMPPLMKLWLDEVLSFGWAYGPGGTALHGKDVWLVASTGSPEDSYRPDGHNRYFFDAFMPPYEQTAALCGIRFLPPMVLHGAHRASAEVVAEHARTYAERLSTYPRWPEIDDMPECPECQVPSEARPRSSEEREAIRDPGQPGQPPHAVRAEVA